MIDKPGSPEALQDWLEPKNDREDTFSSKFCASGLFGAIESVAKTSSLQAHPDLVWGKSENRLCIAAIPETTALSQERSILRTHAPFITNDVKLLRLVLDQADTVTYHNGSLSGQLKLKDNYDGEPSMITLSVPCVPALASCAAPPVGFLRLRHEHMPLAH
jgi:hypothetical protein